MATAPQQVQPDPDLQSGVQYLRAGWFDRAEPHFRAAHGRYGDRPDILHYLAVCVSQRGALAEAEKLWRKALAKDPNEAMLNYNLGLVQRRLGKLDEAAKRFRDTIRRTPAHIEARLALAGIHIDQHKFTAAERELSEVIANLDRALELVDGAQLRPVQSRARNMLGHVLYRLGHFEPALQVLEQALRDADEDAPRRAQILADRALALGGLSRHDDAIAEAEQAVTLAPQNGAINHALGFVLYFAGRMTEAIARLEKAVELDPNFTQAHRTLALAQSAAGKADEAQAVLQRVLATNPHDRDAVLQLSLLHLNGKRPEAALQVVEPYLKAAPHDSGALNNQGLALRGLKRLDEARRSFKRAHRHAASDPMVLTNFGAVLVDLGRAAEAKPLHEQALRGAPDDPRLLANYGICLAALGEKERARETLDNALAADPNNDEALLARAGLDA